MQKRTYYIPTIEVIRVNTRLMQEWLDTSDGHGTVGKQAPRNDSMKAF